jgi:tripartite-type tricarboxylate transporter receptor subunit TctC
MLNKSALARFVLVLCSMVACVPAALAQSWPTKPVRTVIPYSPGGSVDILLRMISDRLSQRLGQPFIVEAKPGGSGLLATNEVLRAAPDGHTLLVFANGITNMHLTLKTEFDVRRDLLPVTMVRGGMLAAWISPTLPVNNFREFIAYAKANPGKLNYGSQGPGTNNHLEFEMLKQLAGIDVVQVPYKGGEAPIIQGLLGGDVHIYLGSFLVLGPMYKSGKVKLIAVGGEKRSTQFPEVPTYREQGIPFTNTYWFGYFMPAKTPIEIARKLQAELKAVYQIPEVYAVLTRNGEDVGGQTPEEFARTVNTEAAAWEGVVKRIGYVPE